MTLFILFFRLIAHLPFRVTYWILNRVKSILNFSRKGINDNLLSFFASETAFQTYLEQIYQNKKRFAYYIYYFFKFACLSTYKRSKYFRLSGIYYPGIAVISINEICNQRCADCFHPKSNISMSEKQFDDAIKMFNRKGVFVFALIGGEPFLHPKLLDMVGKKTGSFFLIFTNGSVISDADIRKAAVCQNMILIISDDGGAERTEHRKPGFGTIIQETTRKIDELGIDHAISVMVTEDNLAFVTSKEYLKSIYRKNTRLIFYFHRVFVDENTRRQSIGKECLDVFNKRVELLKENSYLLVSLPFDILKIKGRCIAGREYLHIGANGDVHGCPFHTENFGNIYKEPLDKIIERANSKNISSNENQTGCAFFQNIERSRKASESNSLYESEKIVC